MVKVRLVTVRIVVIDANLLVALHYDWVTSLVDLYLASRLNDLVDLLHHAVHFALWGKGGVVILKSLSLCRCLVRQRVVVVASGA